MTAFAWVALTSFDPRRESPYATSSVTKVTPTAIPFLPTQPPPTEAPAPRPWFLKIQSPAQIVISAADLKADPNADVTGYFSSQPDIASLANDDTLKTLFTAAGLGDLLAKLGGSN